MRTMSLTRLLPAALAALSLSGPAFAQGAAPAPGSLFKEVIKQPTGKNGYEELVAAAEVLKGSKLWAKAEQPDALLADKRLALGDRLVVRALALMRQGLSKPVFSPREGLQPGTLPPELSGLRSLGRLAAVHQYVAFADGRTSEALADARLGMRLGQVIQQDSLLGGMVGLAVGATCIRPLATHLDQLSVRDCDLLKVICEEWLAQPNPLPRVVAAERKVVLTNLADLKQKTGAGAGGDDLFGTASKYANDYFDRQLLELNKPAWQRGALGVDDAPEFSRALLSPVAQILERTLSAYTREEANVRMLAVHALIIHARWEQGHLPSALAEVNAGDLALDPFTGKALQYEVLGRTYRLFSAGPLAPATDPQAVNGRKPVAVVPE
jgi:hypothetical protein